MADEQQVAETSVAPGALKSLLAEWDDHVSKSFVPPPNAEEIVPRDPEEIAAFDKRIETLEGEKSDLSEQLESLEGEKSDLSKQLEQSEGVANFVEQTVALINQHDFDRTVKLA